MRQTTLRARVSQWKLAGAANERPQTFNQRPASTAIQVGACKSLFYSAQTPATKLKVRRSPTQRSHSSPIRRASVSGSASTAKAQLRSSHRVSNSTVTGMCSPFRKAKIRQSLADIWRIRTRGRVGLYLHVSSAICSAGKGQR